MPQPNPGFSLFLPPFAVGSLPHGESEARSSEPTGDRADDEALVALLAAGLRLQASDNLWRVSGNTLPHRALLREAGGAWNRLDQCWDFAGEDPTAKLAAALAAAPGAGGRPQQRRGRAADAALLTAIAPGCASAC